MEGERILCVLKSEGSVSGIHGLLNDVKNYLGPVLSAAKTKAAKPKDTSQFGKYELFSLKLLKQCIEQCKKVKQCDAPSLLKVGSISVDCLEVCTNCSKRVPPLSFEKLLFHFASQCFNCADYATGLKSCQVLHTQLLAEKMNVTELKEEGSTLLKHTFEVLWKAALKMEQKLSQNGAAFESSEVETCLELRRNAFLCLTSTDFDLDFVLDRILKTDLRYQKLSTGSNQTDPTHNPFKRLYSFHMSLLQHRDLCTLIQAHTPCKTFTAGIDYLLHLAKVCMNSSNLKECGTFISRAQILCEEHVLICRENGHRACAIQAQVMSLLATIRDLDVYTGPNHSEINFSEETLQVLEGIASDLRVHTSSIDVVFIPRLTDSLEMLVSALEDKRSDFQQKLSVQREKSFIPKQVFLPLQEIVNCYTECIESHLQEQLKSAQPDKMSTLELATRSHQLSMLAFMAQVLLDLLLARDDIECDEIEIMRSSASSKMSMQAPPHPRKELADLCIPVLQTSQGVIKKAPYGLLPSAEHKWLGNNAYNLGLALFRSELYHEAASVLELACRELSVWCGEGSGERERVQRSEESQLLKKFTLLIDCYRQSACYTDTLEAVELAITSLPTNQIASTACASVLASQWVKAKRDIAATGTFSAHELSQRTTLQALEREGRVSLEVKVLFLEQELKMYKTQSYNTQPDQLAVAKLLLDLYTSEEDDSKVVDRARAMVEMAAIMRECDDDSYSSLSLLDEALSLLEPLTSSHPPPHRCRVYEQLAVTHLWKAICTQEQMINSTSQNSIPAASDTTKADPTDKTDQLCLSSLQEQSMQCDDVGQCLHSAVESWGALWGVVREKGVGKSKCNECFHDVSVTFQYLHLTTSLCLALMKPLLALKTLGTLINIYEWAPLPDLTVPYQNALAQHCELVLSLTGRGPNSKVESAEATCDDASVKGKAVLEQQASHLSCQLALAKLRLEQGQFDECRRLLVGVFESPILSRHSTLSYTLTARAKLLASLYLQHRQFDIKPSEEFLQYMLSETHLPFEEIPFKLTAHELAMDAVKIYRSLASKHNVVSERNQACNKEDDRFDGNEGFIDSETTDSFVEANATEMTVSPSVTAWDTLNGLMMSLKTVAEVWLQQGGVREAYFYAREGMSLAKSVLLHGWYVEFLLLLAHIQETRGQSDSSRTLLLQTGRLLELDHYLTLPQDAPKHSTPPPSPLRQSEGSSSDESLLEELASLRITTCTHKTQKTSLSLHPDSCMCCTCTNHTHLLQMATALKLWAALQIKDDVARALGSLSSTLEFVRGGVQKCDNALALVHHAEVPRKPKRSQKKGAQPQSVLSITDSTAYISLILQLQTHQSQAHLQLNSPQKSLGVCKEALSAVQSAGIKTSGPAISPALAELHYTMGEACLGEMDSHHPGAAEKLWDNQFNGGLLCQCSDEQARGSMESGKSKVPGMSSKPARNTSQKKSDSKGKGRATVRGRQPLEIGTENDHGIINIPQKVQEKSSATTKRGSRGVSAKKRVSQKTQKSEPAIVIDSSSSDDELTVVTTRRHPRRVLLDSSGDEDEAPGSRQPKKMSTARGTRKKASHCYNPHLTKDCGNEKKDAVRGEISGSKQLGKKGAKTKSTTQGGARTATQQTVVDTQIKLTGAKSFLSSGVIPDIISQALSNFLMSYQYCYPTAPSLLLRDICVWLCVCLSPFHTELASHYLLLSTQLTLSHQAVYAMGKKIRKNQSSDSDSPHHDVIQTLSSPLSPCHHNPEAIIKARNTLQFQPTPTTRAYTRSLIQTLPSDWSICSISLAPKTQQGKQYLLVLQVMKEKSPFLVKIPLRSTSELEEFNDIHTASADSMTIGEKRVWWNTRRKLDKQMQEILCRLETSWLGHWRTMLCSGSCDPEVARLAAEVREELDWFGVNVSVRCAEMLVEGGRSIEGKEMVSVVEEIGQGKLTRPQCEQISVHVTSAIPHLKRNVPCPVFLVLGQSLQCLPWESLPVLSHQSVSRMPSLVFTIAHKQHLSHNGNTTIDPCKTFYVVNPRNDLPNTEKVFSKWFSSERGWKGVVGRAPTEEEYSSALEDHDLFIYCGHGTGREYLHTDVFQQLECQATTLLMGCSSGQLAVGGRCDPTGMALNYLITGCPALVANLWDVTDGDIDRFCQALLKSWLGHGSELSLAGYVADARSVCKLQRLIGASPVVYGIPVVARQQ